MTRFRSSSTTRRRSAEPRSAPGVVCGIEPRERVLRVGNVASSSLPSSCFFDRGLLNDQPGELGEVVSEAGILGPQLFELSGGDDPRFVRRGCHVTYGPSLCGGGPTQGSRFARPLSQIIWILVTRMTPVDDRRGLTRGGFSRHDGDRRVHGLIHQPDQPGPRDDVTRRPRW